MKNLDLCNDFYQLAAMAKHAGDLSGVADGIYATARTRFWMREEILSRLDAFMARAKEMRDAVDKTGVSDKEGPL